MKLFILIEKVQLSKSKFYFVRIIYRFQIIVYLLNTLINIKQLTNALSVKLTFIMIRTIEFIKFSYYYPLIEYKIGLALKEKGETALPLWL